MMLCGKWASDRNMAGWKERCLCKYLSAERDSEEGPEPGLMDGMEYKQN